MISRLGATLGMVVAVSSAVAVAMWGPAAGSTGAPPYSDQSSDQLTGPALARSLDLQLETAMPSGCQAYVEVSEPAGYCLDGRVEPGIESWDVAQRLRGEVPSGSDRRIYELELQLSEISPSLENRDQIQTLIEELEALLEQQAE